METYAIGLNTHMPLVFLDRAFGLLAYETLHADQLATDEPSRRALFHKLAGPAEPRVFKFGGRLCPDDVSVIRLHPWVDRLKAAPVAAEDELQVDWCMDAYALVVMSLPPSVFECFVALVIERDPATARGSTKAKKLSSALARYLQIVNVQVAARAEQLRSAPWGKAEACQRPLPMSARETTPPPQEQFRRMTMQPRPTLRRRVRDALGRVRKALRGWTLPRRPADPDAVDPNGIRREADGHAYLGTNALYQTGTLPLRVGGHTGAE